MRNAINVAKIAGIDIKIDPSWLLIFGLVTWNLVTVLTRLHPDWSTALTLSTAVLAALLFFGSVLVHELAHAVVAIAHGIPVRDITLFFFGGVATIEREPPSPRAEFTITIVGPLASFALGIVFLLAGGLVGDVSLALARPQDFLVQLDPVATVLSWLGSINILLAIFNLVPGFPLDGGRVLRSILWAATGDLRTATRQATLVGRATALVFMALGIAMIFGAEFPVLGTGVFGGIWLIGIGWFLNHAAVQSYRQMTVRDALRGLPVARLMRSNVPTVRPETTVQTLVGEHILRSDDRAFPVVEGDQLVGLVRIDDVRKVADMTWATTTVREVMTPVDQLVVAAPDEEASHALAKLVRRDMNHMPVLHGHRLVGMLLVRDVVRWLDVQGERA